ncbi:MAG TPA: hypothetical protein VFQ52_03265, partial [Rhizomicrobium sp.]|nr:hypothetical protein [Rhizomicrobium sp.]
SRYSTPPADPQANPAPVWRPESTRFVLFGKILVKALKCRANTKSCSSDVPDGFRQVFRRDIRTSANLIRDRR